MRMRHYYGAMAVATALALVATAATGALGGGGERHLSVGLFGALLAVATNTLLILFMIVTGKVLKEAMATRPLPPAFLAELNAFFAEKRAYPVAVLSAVLVAAVAVLGYAPRAFGTPAALHPLLGLVAVLVELWALQAGWHALRENQDLLDRAAATLDALDRDAPPPEPPPAPRATAGTRLLLAASAWLPYLYWGLVEWRGDFGRVPLWLPLGCALVSVLVLVRGRARSPDGA